MKNLKASFSSFFNLACDLLNRCSSRNFHEGALIIASVEGQVTVINNESKQPLPAAKIIAGGVIYDGHTVKTGPSSK